jgi:hypothetical protein
MARVIIKIGDLFAAKVSDKSKKYFQFIAVDNTQLGSHVIRGFQTEFPVDTSPDPAEIVRQPVAFYAHAFLRTGVKLNFWEKVGNSPEIGRLDHILFRGTNDYGHKLGEKPVEISHIWYVWKINDPNFTRIGELRGPYKDAFVGIVFNPLDIIEFLKGNFVVNGYPKG